MEFIVKGLIVLFSICKKKEHEIKAKAYFGVIFASEIYSMGI